MKQKSKNYRKSSKKDVAIIGIGLRFPGSPDAEMFWENLSAGKSLITEIPAHRWDWRQYTGNPRAEPNKTNSKWGGFLEDIECFDSSFFNISPREADLMDPQQRIVLELAWSAIEDAGYRVSSLSGTDMGIFIGASHNDYSELIDGYLTEIDPYMNSGTDSSVIANRVSYFFNFHGPSITINTACSSSLVAFHQAVLSIREGDCEIALAGGVNICWTPKLFIASSRAGMLSGEGKCKTFDDSADGYVRAEGAGLVLLKPLKQAVTDGDYIYAVVRGTAINHGGKVNALTVPSAEAQARLLVKAYENARVSPDTVSYIETHGTGTSLGDPIEIHGLKTAFTQLYKKFRKKPNRKHFCGLGSVKTNIGHLEPAAGIAGLIKVLLAMKYKKLPATLNLNKTNRLIKIENTPFYFVKETQDWKQSVEENGDIIPRRAGVSSFGFGGVNAHVVLEEYEESGVPLDPSAGNMQVIVLSAKNTDRLKAYAGKWVDFLEKAAGSHPGVGSKAGEAAGESHENHLSLVNAAYTLQTGREPMEERLAVITSGNRDLEDKLSKFIRGEQEIEHVYRGNIKANQAVSELSGDENERKLENLAGSWVTGIDIDWKKLYPGKTPLRINLPTYPFARKKHWVHSHEKNSAGKMIENTPPADFDPASYQGDEVALKIIDGHIALVIIQDKKNKNLFSDRVARGLTARFQEIRRDGNIKAVIITGYDNIFCMGGTRETLINIHEKKNKCSDMTFAYQGLLQCEVPVIGAVQGHALGGGLVFGLFADIVVMAEESVYSANFMKYGFTPGVGATFILKEKLGNNLAAEMMFTARSYRGEELKARGIPFIFRKQEDVLKEALSIARMLAEKPRQALKVLKMELAGRILARLPDILQREVEMHNQTFSHPEVKERILRFFNKSSDTPGEPAMALTGINVTNTINTENTVNAGRSGAKITLKPRGEKPSGPVDREEAGVNPAVVKNQEQGAVPGDVVTIGQVQVTDLETIQGIIIDIVCGVLHFQENDIDVDMSFNDLGIDSISGVEIVRDINKALELNLDAVIIYDYSNISRLVQYCHQELTKNNKAFIPPAESVPMQGKAESEKVRDVPFETPGSKILLKQKLNLEPGPEFHQESASFPGEIPDILADDREKDRDAGQPPVLSCEDIAVIGVSGRFPGARNLDEFWQNLVNGIDSVREVPAERWDIDRYYDPNPQVPNKTYCRSGGFLDGVDRFDPLFFNISPLEAEVMDPQQRLFLEEAWRALESTGCSPESFAGKNCGVFVGVAPGDYARTVETRENAFDAKLLMGSSNCILAARIAYFLDLTGPNIPIYTACSSSLVAIHQACRSIINGESEVALAGGVCVLTRPDLYLMTCSAGMLSPTGKCNTFDNDSDGFVPAEGVGVVVLKSLEKAKKDNDIIWGVIKGSGVNQDGKTNGITAPSADSQYRLETGVYRKYNIDPTEITFVEAHGTGTKLGDPIEINALTRSFREYTGKKQYCAIGSVKTNIGHTLTAAGVASLIKVLLCLKNRQIPPSLNFKKENEHINFQETPFFVNTGLREWETNENIPRRAAVSSFGFSGTNCHIVVEEAPPPPARQQGTSSASHYFIPLSAKTKESLDRVIKDFLYWLGREGRKESIADIAYTLLLGRSHFSFRCALVVSDKIQLEQKLGIIRQGGSPADCRVDRPGEKPDRREPLLSALGKEIIEELRSNRPGPGEYKEKLLALADLYVSGCHLEWQQLYEDENYQRIFLPAYPFARESYWISSRGSERQLPAADAVLHPLLDVNESTLTEERFRKRLRATEFYLKDHVVDGRLILPGVVYLEMARAAGEIAGGAAVTVIRDVIWGRPIEIEDSSREIYIGLYPDRDTVVYNVYSDEAGQRTVYSRGKLVLNPGGESASKDRENGKYDLESIKKRCPVKISQEEIYRQYKDMGLDYREGFRVTREMYCGSQEAIARLSLPRALLSDFSRYRLHPSLLDGALRVTMRIGGKSRQAGEKPLLLLPFALEELELRRPLTNDCYAYAVVSSGASGDRQQDLKYNISILDQAGNELVKIRNFTPRPAAGKGHPTSIAHGKPVNELIYFCPTWEKTPLPVSRDDSPGRELTGTLVIFDTTDDVYKEVINTLKGVSNDPPEVVLVMPGDSYEKSNSHLFKVKPGNRDDYHHLFRDLKKQGAVNINILHLWSFRSGSLDCFDHSHPDRVYRQMEADLEEGLYSVLYLFQALTAPGLETGTRCLLVYPGRGMRSRPQYEAMSGFANSLTTVNHRFELVGLQLEQEEVPVRKLSGLLLDELTGPDYSNSLWIRYVKEERWIRTLHRITEPGKDNPSYSLPLKTKGVYLLTGGTGGLGMIFSRYLAGKYQGRLILVGRSGLDARKQQQLEELRQLGGEALYLQADVSRYIAVEEVIRGIKEKFHTLDGIFHTAGIDEGVLLKDTHKQAFEKVLLPKLQGTVNLDLATRGMELEVFVLFSSIAAYLGDFGIGSYAWANSFMDSYADFRQQHGPGLHGLPGKRSGKIVSINWPFWTGGGMKLPANEASLYFDYSGMKSLDEAMGLQAFESILAADLPRVIVAYGDVEKITGVLKVPQHRERVHLGEKQEDLQESRQTLQSDESELFQKTGNYLKELIARAIKIPLHRIDAHAPLENFGISSVMIMDLNNLLEKDFESFPRTLFFEYRNLHDLTGYFVRSHEQRLREILGLHRPDTQPFFRETPVHERTNIDSGVDVSRQQRFIVPPVPEYAGSQLPTVGSKEESDGVGDIAIIGVSGRYPMAMNPEEFWNNLKAGKDCIEEIPPQRWDYHLYFDPETNKPGKMYSKWGGFIKDVDKFDPLFFNISPHEAEMMDPQERLFLETAWLALEDAGYSRKRLSIKYPSGQGIGSSIGVFVGVMRANYGLFGGNSDYSAIANRVSYFLDAHGPSLAIDTACSSSLLAIHLACESLKKRECHCAVAGGVNVSIHPRKYIDLCQINILSTDGRCRSFGAGGDGYVPGEGVGTVLLKPLEAAVADNDYIYAVIKGSVTNHGGKTNGYTVPNPKAQADLIYRALKKSNIHPRTISYIEAHGTGTPLGDPIEITGLTRAFARYSKEKQNNQDKQYCALGSVKSNLGHLEGAAGIAAVTKVLLQMKHRQLAPSLHARTLNPNIDFAGTPFYVQQELSQWRRPVTEEGGRKREFPRRAGISSFGAGGTNVHIILEEFTASPAPGPRDAAIPGKPELIVLSARNREQLGIYVRQIIEFLEKAGAAPDSSDSQSSGTLNRDAVIRQVHQDLVRIASGIIHVEEKNIDPAVELSEYGFDPVKLVELAERICGEYNIEVKPGIFLEHSTLGLIREYLIETYEERFIFIEENVVERESKPRKPSPLNIADIAYMLQVGREAMEERLALLANTPQELLEKLNDYLARQDNPGDSQYVFQGNIESTGDSTFLPGQDSEDIEYLGKILRKGNLEKIARLWVSGVDIQWDLLQRDSSPRCISLPGYPFARERYWLDGENPALIPQRPVSPEMGQPLHPLIDINESTLEEEIFKKTLEAGEYFLKDHRIDGQIILPGVAYLEMARAAGELAGKRPVRMIKDVMWVRPVVLNRQSQDIYIGLYPEGDAVIFQVYAVETGEKLVFSQGKLVYDGTSPGIRPDQAIHYSLEDIKKKCTTRQEKTGIYQHLRNNGFHYGKSFQVVQQVYGSQTEAIAQLRLPEELREHHPRYVLHPSLLDGALQSLMVIRDGRVQGNSVPRLPFALGQLEIHKSLTEVCYAYASISPDNPDGQDGIIKFNIILLNESGEELVRLKDYTARMVKDTDRPTARTPVISQVPAKKLLYYYPSWDNVPLPIPASSNISGVEAPDALVIFDSHEDLTGKPVVHFKGTPVEPGNPVVVKPGDSYWQADAHNFQINPRNPGDYQQLFQQLRRQGKFKLDILHLWSYREDSAGSLDFVDISRPDRVYRQLASDLEQGLYSVLYLFQAVHSLRLETDTRCLFVYPGGEEQGRPQHEAISGFAHSLTTVDHKFRLGSCQLDAEITDTRELYRLGLAEITSPVFANGLQVRYERGQRFERILHPFQDPMVPARPGNQGSTLLKPGGVYLITGGAGGLGMMVSRYLAEKYRARLILTGRSMPDNHKEAQVSGLQRLGGEAIYLQADASDLKQVEKVIGTIKKKYSRLDGVFHIAGLGRGEPVDRVNKEGFDRIILPKVYGTINLDMAMQEMNPDFLLLFSSISAYLGDFGMGSYGWANSFMDNYAAQRERLRQPGKRKGRTISVNWPYWAEGGMTLPADEASLYFEYSGMTALDESLGLQAMEDIGSFDAARVVVAVGDEEKINRVLKVNALTQAGIPQPLENAAAANPAAGASPAPGNTGNNVPAQGKPPAEKNLFRETETYLKDLLYQALKLPPHQVSSRATFEKYGIDSIKIMKLNALLEKDFKSLPRTLFFQYHNLYDLTGYFVKNHEQQLKEVLRFESSTGEASSPASPVATLSPDAFRAVEQSPALLKGNRNRFIPARSPGIGDNAGVSVKAGTPPEDKSANEEIAIIGVSGRYPMANDLDTFWENLKAGKDCIREIPPERWDYRPYFHPVPKTPGKTYGKWGGFIDDIDRFDPLFFNISPREAEIMDPQERLFLETVWLTLEDAGYTRELLSDPGKPLGGCDIGVFAGVMWGNYRLYGGNSNYSTIANRVSYFLDSHGPSLSIDTACSSSLLAIHLACESLRKGECRVAAAGGVNVSIHPIKYINLSQVQILSTDGRCRSFGAGGDGYSPGEGVGAVLLKPLEQAFSDGDHIYAVIKGSATNHGGKTNGYTVPNPNAQAELIRQTLEKCRINPRTISYIEAHGTGTALGDPIEITGLTTAFSAYTTDKQYCSIGSVKSNLGHLEGAAGIASVAKVLLQMKHGQLAPSIHSQTLNPNIDFAGTPFYVQRQLNEWKRPVAPENGRKKEYPRRVGVSSFGAGGTNVHIILEEYTGLSEPEPAAAQVPKKPQLIGLSAQNRQQLEVYAGKLAGFLDLDREKYAGSAAPRLADIGYTLLKGREAMEERLAVVVNGVDELKEKLNRFSRGQTGDPDKEKVYVGKVTEGDENENIGFSTGQQPGEERIKSIIRAGNLKELAQLWVRGTAVDFMLLYEGQTPRRISLPAYPFSKERYWMPEIYHFQGKADRALHPLIDQVVPGLSLGEGIVFQKTLTGSDWIVKDHVVNGKPLLPGVGYLEMAYAAAAQVKNGRDLDVSRVAWSRPLVVEDDQRTVYIAIKENENKLVYEVRSSSGDQQITHARGEFYFKETLAAGTADAGLQRLDIEEIKKRCSREIDRNRFYAGFTGMGFTYGAYFQGVNQVWVNHDEALAYLTLPAEGRQEFNRYTFHPTLMDAALQTIGGLTIDSGREQSQLLLPFSVEAVSLVNPLGTSAYAYVKTVGEHRYNVAILDETGLVCIKLRDVVFREIKDSLEQFCYIPGWVAAPLPSRVKADSNKPGNKSDREDVNKRTVLVVYTQPGADLGKALSAAHAGDSVIEIKIGAKTKKEAKKRKSKNWEIDCGDPSAPDRCVARLKDIQDLDTIYFLGLLPAEKMEADDLQLLEQGQESGVLSLFRLIKALNRHGLLQRSSGLKVITNNIHPVGKQEATQPYAAGLIGLTKTVAREYKKTAVACIDIDLGTAEDEIDEKGWQSLARQILAEPYAENAREVALRTEHRYIRTMEPVCLPEVSQENFRHRGVYLILGGAGGIGFELARYLAGKVEARLVLVGRSELDARKKQEFSQIEQNGAKVLYIQADATDAQGMKAAVEKARNHFGQINGVVHSAVKLRDKMLDNMDEALFRETFDSKVKGSVILYNVLKDEPLDFMMFFSSAVSFDGNAGQGNYAAASTFEDAFALHLDQRTGFPVKVINWGYWGTVGAVASEQYKKRLQAAGLYSIAPAEGMEIIRRVLAGPAGQIMALKADARVLARLGVRLPSIQEPSPPVVPVQQRPAPHTGGKPISGADLAETTRDYVKGVLSGVLKINKDKLENQATFEKYGIDSLLVLEITETFEKDFGVLPKTLLFEYMTIEKLSAYFMSEYQDRLHRILKLPQPVRDAAELFSGNEELGIRDMVYNLPEESVDSLLNLILNESADQERK